MKNNPLNIAAALLSLTTASCFAVESTVPQGVPKLNHVFLIIMENHSYDGIRSSLNAPFINSMADAAKVADNYSATEHPSLPNYLTIIGGSNFNVASDNGPDWHSTSCTPFTDTGSVCPIEGMGTENSSGTPNITGKSIADQLESKKLSWKNYQQSLPLTGADGVIGSDGFYSNLTDFTNLGGNLGDIAYLYAVKHSPFVYFKSGQQPERLLNTVGFEGSGGLYSDLGAGKVANLSLIVPNQCNDQHGTNGEFFCGDSAAKIERGDQTVARIVTAIKASKVWKQGNNVIVLTWDEDDYSASNQVLMVVDTNRVDTPSVSNVSYNHFSLLKTLEAGFRLPCLNHACDNNVSVMSDMFIFSGSRE